MTTTDELTYLRRVSSLRLSLLARWAEGAPPESDQARTGRLAFLELQRRRARDDGDGKRQRERRLEQDRLVREADPA